MMKKLILIFTCLGMFLCVYGCHGKHQTSHAFVVPDHFDTERQFEISFWAKNDTNLTQVAAYKKAIADFQEYYPNVKVNLKLYTDYSRIYNDVITNIATDTTPNVCITYPDHIATYLTGDNIVVSLDELCDDQNYGLGGKELKFQGVKKEEIVPKFLQEGKIEGSQYALPFMRSSEVLYINKTYVEKMGYELKDIYTWDEIFAIASKAMEKGEDGKYLVNGQDVLIPFIYKSTDNMMIQMLKQKQAAYSTNEGDILIFNDDTKQILNNVYQHALDGSFSTFKISSYPGNFLNAGQCLFAIDSTAGSSWMGKDAPLGDIPEENKVDFETVVRIIPQYDISNPSMISQGPSIAIFNKQDDQEVLASWLFAQYLLTDDIQLAYASSEGYIPVTSKAQKSEQYQDYLAKQGEDNNLHYDVKIASTKLLLENIDNTFTTPVFNGSTSLRNAAGQMIEEVCKDSKKNKVVDGAYFDSLYDNMTSLYHLNETQGLQSQKELGPLPLGSKLLIGTLIVVWAGIGIYFVYNQKKQKM